MNIEIKGQIIINHKKSFEEVPVVLNLIFKIDDEGNIQSFCKNPIKISFMEYNEETDSENPINLNCEIYSVSIQGYIYKNVTPESFVLNVPEGKLTLCYLNK